MVFILPTLTNKQTMAMQIAPSVSCSSFSFKILLHLLLFAMASMYTSAKVWSFVPSLYLVKHGVLSEKTALRKSYWMSFRQSGIPSSFLRCRILLPEYTELTLPLALRLVDVVVEVYNGPWFGEAWSSPSAASVLGVSPAGSSKTTFFLGAMVETCDSAASASGAGGGIGGGGGSCGSGARM